MRRVREPISLERWDVVFAAYTAGARLLDLYFEMEESAEPTYGSPKAFENAFYAQRPTLTDRAAIIAGAKAQFSSALLCSLGHLTVSDTCLVYECALCRLSPFTWRSVA
jgi:hypothetical protein